MKCTICSHDISLTTEYCPDCEEANPLFIGKLIDSVIDNTSLDYASGHNSGISDRYRCSQCGEDVRCQDHKKATLSDIDHSDDCPYVLANKLSEALDEDQ